MNIFQVVYAKIRYFKWPWLTKFLGIVQNNILIPAAKAVGIAGINYIKMKILEEATKDNPGSAKFSNVYNACRKEFTTENIGNDFLTNLIQNTVSEMKIEKVID